MLCWCLAAVLSLFVEGELPSLYHGFGRTAFTGDLNWTAVGAPFAAVEDAPCSVLALTMARSRGISKVC